MEGARTAFQRAIESGHAVAAPASAVTLGSLLAERGDVEGARAAFQRAIDSGYNEAANAALQGIKALRRTARWSRVKSWLR